jgi:hypothetical protein
MLNSFSHKNRGRTAAADSISLFRRRLSVSGVRVSLGDLQSTLLTHLAYGGLWWRMQQEKLVSADIAIISNMTSLKRLELCKWEHWDDLSSLRLLCLEEIYVSYPMLHDLGPLFSSYMQMLKAVTIERSEDNQYQWEEWLTRNHLSEEGALAGIAQTLLELPQLVALKDESALRDVIIGEGVVKDVISSFLPGCYHDKRGIVAAIVANHPAHWRWEGSVGQDRYSRVRG